MTIDDPITAEQADAYWRTNERRALRGRLICAALTGLMRQTTAPEQWYAERAISQADAVLAALDEVDALQLLAATPEKLEP